MSERGRDPQAFEDGCDDEDAKARMENIARLIYFDKADDRTVDEWLAWIGRRTSLPSFLWACLYVFLTTPFMRGFRHALTIMLALMFCLALLTFYFMIAMTVKR